jgi:uncharacterized protein YutE (UPF0331/DUF86 family)
MRYDIERIGILKGDIENYFDDLEELDIKGPEDFENKIKYYSTSMIIFQIMNRAIDLGQELLGVEGMKKVSLSYREVFALLKKKGTISKQLHEDLDRLVSMRNIIAHEYGSLNEPDIYEVYCKIGSVKELLGIIEEKLNG